MIWTLNKNHLKQHLDHYWWLLIREIGSKNQTFLIILSRRMDDFFRCCQGLKIICVCVFLSDFIDHEPFQITPGKTPPVYVTPHTLLSVHFRSFVCHVAHWRTCHVMTRSNVSRDTGNYPGGGHRDIASCAPRPVPVCHQSSVSLIKTIKWAA